MKHIHNFRDGIPKVVGTMVEESDLRIWNTECSGNKDKRLLIGGDLVSLRLEDKQTSGEVR